MGDLIYGIDLGTTNSAIAVYRNGQAEILKNIDGYETTPSVVFFTGTGPDGKDETLVGEGAKNSAAASPGQVVQFIKRQMGKKGAAYNYISPSGKAYSPEMISALILRKVCSDAETYEGEGAVRNVVITVPAYFDDARRTATKQAGKIAGLNVVSVINEPTAAAIAYGLDADRNGKVMVYDLGGGTFDVTVMEINGGRFDVLATGGDHELGGLNFDQKLIEIIIRKLQAEGCFVDDEDDALMGEILEKAEKTKIQLSGVGKSRPVFTIGQKTCRIEISRAEFEDASKDLLKRTRFLVETVLADGGINLTDISQILAVGGSTKMPMVRKLLEDMWGEKINYKVDPDTAVARGAAIFGSTLDFSGNSLVETETDLSGSGSELAVSENRYLPVSRQNGIAKIRVSDVTSQSLGFITVDPYDHSKLINTIVIPHNTRIPTKRSGYACTIQDHQREIHVQVTEGDDEDVEYISIIGEALLQIPDYPKGAPIEIIYAYDPDQTVCIEVVDLTTNRNLGNFEIERRSNLSEDQVENATGIVSMITVE